MRPGTAFGRSASRWAVCLARPYALSFFLALQKEGGYEQRRAVAQIRTPRKMMSWTCMGVVSPSTTNSEFARSQLRRVNECLCRPLPMYHRINFAVSQAGPN
ncbi:hypothetical protein GY45DRAFT_112170 [Cubamyces sp. BRFM 1775]|nr:hypothetical protein GY45DRAFT_112170 [Cubamyces sp. BRFM 1775]